VRSVLHLPQSPMLDGYLARSSIRLPRLARFSTPCRQLMVAAALIVLVNLHTSVHCSIHHHSREIAISAFRGGWHSWAE